MTRRIQRGDPLAEQNEAESCDHSETEHLGSNRAMEFFRCHRCGSVLVFHSGGWWAIPPPPDAA